MRKRLLLPAAASILMGGATIASAVQAFCWVGPDTSYDTCIFYYGGGSTACWDTRGHSEGGGGGEYWEEWQGAWCVYS